MESEVPQDDQELAAMVRSVLNDQHNFPEYAMLFI
jgi:hypothetical protein